MSSIVATHLSVNAGDASLVRDASIRFSRGELVAILGPNGAGKTSLLRALMGLAKAAAGSVTIDGEDGVKMSATERARHVSYLPQIRPLAWPANVHDVVALGRFAHGAALGKLGDEDAIAVKRAIEACDLIALADRKTDTLSGGEIARVHFARALAANTPLLIADEPVAALDPLHQLSLAALLTKFVDNGGGALVVLHEVALAARIATRLVWMQGGKIVADGPPEETLTAERMREIYGVRAAVTPGAHGPEVRIEGIA